MNFKKIITLLLAFMLCLSFVACTDVSDSQTDSKPEEISFKEKVFVDNENCTFKITGVDPDGFMGYTLKAELENKTGKNLMFTLEDVSVNGYMCEPLWATSVQSGKKSKSDITFFSDDFKELGIEKVENIEFTLRAYDEDDFMAPDVLNETYTYVIGE